MTHSSFPSERDLRFTCLQLQIPPFLLSYRVSPKDQFLVLTLFDIHKWHSTQNICSLMSPYSLPRDYCSLFDMQTHR
jgi:hypothetical protein